MQTLSEVSDRIYFKLFLIVVALMFTASAVAQESPYFVTYDHHMEEPGNLELETSLTAGTGNDQPSFWAPYAEVEYGVKAWWTSELYLEAQGHENDHAIFTGWRLENRFRPLKREHRINPVLYF